MVYLLNGNWNGLTRIRMGWNQNEQELELVGIRIENKNQNKLFT